MDYFILESIDLHRLDEILESHGVDPTMVISVAAYEFPDPEWVDRIVKSYVVFYRR